MMKDLNDTDMEMKVDDSAVRRYLKELKFSDSCRYVCEGMFLFINLKS